MKRILKNNKLLKDFLTNKFRTMYRIRIDAIITKKRWNDQTDEEFFINKNWSIELETEDKNAVDKLQELNSKSNINSYELPDFVKFHLDTTNEISFDETTDKILKISSFCR